MELDVGFFSASQHLSFIWEASGVISLGGDEHTIAACALRASAAVRSGNVRC